ncbi:hypothetical protein BaRGS_00029310 [Batillaria attramentaria]|uniref:Uncharacterized protein n=1 Tax=Batillaria attramentaria TaxID=370345 RepID=A0ABD0JWP4_9CAEN
MTARYSNRRLVSTTFYLGARYFHFWRHGQPALLWTAPALCGPPSHVTVTSLVWVAAPAETDDDPAQCDVNRPGCHRVLQADLPICDHDAGSQNAREVVSNSLEYRSLGSGAESEIKIEREVQLGSADGSGVDCAVPTAGRRLTMRHA